MGLKEMMLDKIEKDSIKVNVNGDLVYLKKGGIFKEWKVIYPPVNPETGEWNYTNLIFGGTGNAIKTFFIGLLLLMLLYGAYDLMSSYNSVMSNPVVQSCLKTAGISLG